MCAKRYNWVIFWPISNIIWLFQTYNTAHFMEYWLVIERMGPLSVMFWALGLVTSCFILYSSTHVSCFAYLSLSLSFMICPPFLDYGRFFVLYLLISVLLTLGSLFLLIISLSFQICNLNACSYCVNWADKVIVHSVLQHNITHH